jgi:hypothetical protein
MLPSVVRVVGNSSFENCLSLESVSAVNVTEAKNFSLGARAFSGCAALTTVAFPPWISGIANFTFYKCIKLESFIIPENAQSIGIFAFAESGVRQATLPKGVRFIGDAAFENCLALNSVICEFANSSQVKFGIEVFSGCIRLNRIVLSEGLLTISSSMFRNCTDLANINLPSSVSTLGEGCFASSGLISISVPNNVSLVSASAFQNCSKLASIIFPNRHIYMGKYICRGCTGLTSVVLPSDIERIPTGMFYGCSSLRSISLIATTEIGDSAFYGSGLSEIKLPDTVQEVGSSCFGFSSLKSISILDSRPLSLFSEDAFAGCDSLKTIILRGFGLHAKVCDAINYSGFPRSNDVVIEVEHSDNRSVCGRRPIWISPTPAPTGTKDHPKKSTLNWVILGVSLGSLVLVVVAFVLVLHFVVCKRLKVEEPESQIYGNLLPSVS